MKKIAMLFFALISLQARAQNYNAILKSDSTSWITYRLELETREEGHAFVNKKDSLLYYAPYGHTDYYCVGRMREADGRLWIAFNGSLSEETLLVDMNLEEGDEFLVTGYHVAHVVETSRKNGRKVIVFDYISPYWGGEPLKFIEGVGRNYPIFEWYADIDRNYHSCKFDGDELVYSTNNLLFEDCKYNFASVGELSDENKVMKIFPNPARDEVYVHFASIQEIPFEIIVLDFFGKVVKTIPVTGYSIILPVDDLSSGIYVIKAFFQEIVLTNKLIIN